MIIRMLSLVIIKSLDRMNYLRLAYAMAWHGMAIGHERSRPFMEEQDSVEDDYL